MGSQLVPADELGKGFGVVAVCGDLANMAGTLIANSLYSPLRAIQPGCASNQGSCLAGLTHLGAALLVLLGFLLVLLAYRLLVRRERAEEGEARRKEDINEDKVEEEEGGEDNLGYKAEPDSEEKSSSLSLSSSRRYADKSETGREVEDE